MQSLRDPLTWTDSDGVFYVYGGIGKKSINYLNSHLSDHNGQILQQMWKSTDNGISWNLLWSPVSGTSVENSPGQRSASVTYTIGHYLYLFGGKCVDSNTNSLKFCSDLYEWNGEQWNILWIRETEGPSARAFATNWLDDNNNLWIFGGFGLGNDGRLLDDLWKWDGSVWTEMRISGPSAQMKTASWSIGNDLYLWDSSFQQTGTLWKYNGDWSIVTVSSLINPVTLEGAVGWKVDQSFYMYGGIDGILYNFCFLLTIL